jgi:RNA-binding protein YhbY
MIEKNLFFNYEEIQLETSKKKKSLLISPKDLFESFVKSSLKNFNSNDIEDINFFFSNLLSLDFDKIYKNYLSHPIRLAHMWIFINKSVSAEEIKFILAHNIIEAGFLDEIKNNLEKNEIEKIKILTIDRNKENNLDYLNLYYNDIEKHSKNLLIFKSLDKLDNLLIGEKYLFNKYSLNLLKNQICIRLKKYNTRLYDYMCNIINFYEKKYF